MNKRLKELAADAGYPDYMTYGQDKVLERFAELIVKDITAGQRELAKTLSDTGSEDQAYILRITAGNIERKFGVEE